MKKILLGSTALVAAGLIAGDAAAADGVKLSLGGFYRGAAGVAFDDFDGALAGLEDDLRDYVFKQDVEVHFSGETTLDNGLKVGAVIQLEGQTSGDQIDEVYAFFSGGWGEVRFGDDDEALTALCSITPSAAANFGADSPFFNFGNAGAASNPNLTTTLHGAYGATNGTCFGVDGDSTKVIYFSPNFGGFSFAASFTPDNTQDTRNTTNGAATRFENNGGNSENVSVAANFNHDFNGVTLNIGGGATWSFDREANVPGGPDEVQDYQGYASVSFFGFTIGGATEWRYDFGADGGERHVFGAGVTYNWDAWTVGLGWTHGDYEIGQPGGTLLGNALTSDADNNMEVFSLTAAYALGPGITVDGVVEYIDSETDAGISSNDYDGISFGIGTLISF